MSSCTHKEKETQSSRKTSLETLRVLPSERSQSASWVGKSHLRFLVECQLLACERGCNISAGPDNAEV